jgi:hypothetical protein
MLSKNMAALLKEMVTSKEIAPDYQTLQNGWSKMVKTSTKTLSKGLSKS